MPLSIIGNGLYALGEAGLLTGASYRRVRAWFGGEGGREPVAKGDYGPLETQALLSFLDLIDALVVGTLRDAGVSLQYLRKVHDRLLVEFNAEHPFCRKNLWTDGKATLRRLHEIGLYLKDLRTCQWNPS